MSSSDDEENQRLRMPDVLDDMEDEDGDENTVLTDSPAGIRIMRSTSGVAQSGNEDDIPMLASSFHNLTISEESETSTVPSLLSPQPQSKAVSSREPRRGGLHSSRSSPRLRDGLRTDSFLFRTVSDGFAFHARPGSVGGAYNNLASSRSPTNRADASNLAQPSQSIDAVEAKALLERQVKLAELVVSYMHDYSENPETGDIGVGRSPVFESFFDLTRPRLKYIFDVLDKLSSQKSAGIVDYQHLREGLRDAGIEVRDQEKFNGLISAIDMDMDGGVTFNEFETIVQSLKMASLFKSNEIDTNHSQPFSHGYIPSAVSNVPVTPFDCLNYNATTCKRVIVSNENIKDFMYTPRKQRFSCRWIKVSLPNSFVIKALAIKYRLHPLSLEDVLHNNAHIRAKVDMYENHYLITVPVLTISIFENSKSKKESRGSNSFAGYGTFGSNSVLSRKPSTFSRRQSFKAVKYLKRRRSSGATHSSNNWSKGWISPFFRKRRKDSSCTKGTDYQQFPEQDIPCHENAEFLDGDYTVPKNYMVPKLHKSNAFIALTRPQMNTIITAVSTVEIGGDIFERSKQELSLSYSKLRTSNSFYLTYTLLDSIVDSYFPIVTQLDICLHKIRHSVRNLHKTSRAKRNEVNYSRLYHDLLSESAKLQRWLIPLQRVLSHFTKSHSRDRNIDEECRLHLCDVLDNLNQLLDDIQGIMDAAMQVKEEHRQVVDTNLNRTMTGLTIIATIFLPAQFLTGVFGMNFDKMPELHWKWGYPLFWSVCVMSWVLLFLMFSRHW